MIPMLFFRIHPILIGAAVIPAVILMLYIYRSDRLEREPVGLLVKLALLGVLATVFAMIGEKLGFFLLRGLNQSSAAYQLLMNFLVVGLCEEGFKYLLLRGSTWNNPNFNCRYDGVVYAVFLSLGFTPPSASSWGPGTVRRRRRSGPGTFPGADSAAEWLCWSRWRSTGCTTISPCVRPTGTPPPCLSSSLPSSSWRRSGR